jgi:hypothetical protein
MTSAEALAAARTPQEAAAASATLLADVDLLVARAQADAAVRLDAVRACAGAVTAITDQAVAAARDALGEDRASRDLVGVNCGPAVTSAARRRAASRRWQSC